MVKSEPNDLTRTIGEQIQRIRQARGLSQTRLADLAGVAQSFITSIEKGTKSPSVRTLSKVARALDVHPVALFMVPPAVPRSGSTVPPEKQCEHLLVWYAAVKHYAERMTETGWPVDVRHLQERLDDMLHSLVPSWD